MRKLCLYMVVMLLCGCEVIRENERLIPVTPTTSGTRTHVLLEYTGFRCVNCPTAAETAASLQTIYGEQLVVVALHPASNTFTQGKAEYDYTCPEADSIYCFMGGTPTTPFPTGNIDIVPTEDGYFIDKDNWAKQLNSLLIDTVAPYLRASAVLDTVTRTISVTAEYNPREDMRLSVWLVEDSVLGAQAMPDGTVNTAYYHRHMMRAATDQTTLTLPAKCRPAYCSIVALLIDNNDQHIYNAYETDLHLSTHP